MSATQKKQFDVRVDSEACKACGFCENVCPQKVYAQGSTSNTSGYEYMTAAKQDSCVGCGQCVMICPDFAITIAQRGV